jgi:hypothetical protein
MAQAKKPAPSLQCTITYDFVGHLETPDADGIWLVWSGAIHGDIEGVIFWWFDLTAGRETGNVSHYVARWEIWDGVDAELLLAGNSAGTTATPPGKDGIWRGKGIVTEAYGEFEDWIGRPSYESGNVNWDFPYSGEGTFRIN